MYQCDSIVNNNPKQYAMHLSYVIVMHAASEISSSGNMHARKVTGL